MDAKNKSQLNIEISGKCMYIMVSEYQHFVYFFRNQIKRLNSELHFYLKVSRHTFRLKLTNFLLLGKCLEVFIINSYNCKHLDTSISETPCKLTRGC